MLACERPQNSVHWPQNSPGWSAWKVMRLDAAGHGVALAVERGDPEPVDDVA